MNTEVILSRSSVIPAEDEPIDLTSDAAEPTVNAPPDGAAPEATTAIVPSESARDIPDDRPAAAAEIPDGSRAGDGGGPVEEAVESLVEGSIPHLSEPDSEDSDARQPLNVPGDGPVDPLIASPVSSVGSASVSPSARRDDVASVSTTPAAAPLPPATRPAVPGMRRVPSALLRRSPCIAAPPLPQAPSCASFARRRTSVRRRDAVSPAAGAGARALTGAGTRPLSFLSPAAAPSPRGRRLRTPPPAPARP